MKDDVAKATESGRFNDADNHHFQAGLARKIPAADRSCKNGYSLLKLRNNE